MAWLTSITADNTITQTDSRVKETSKFKKLIQDTTSGTAYYQQADYYRLRKLVTTPYIGLADTFATVTDWTEDT